jgi:hypothetical protein
MTGDSKWLASDSLAEHVFASLDTSRPPMTLRQSVESALNATRFDRVIFKIAKRLPRTMIVSVIFIAVGDSWVVIYEIVEGS